MQSRRVVIVAGITFLRRRTQELGATLAISDAAISQHLAQAGTVMDEAAAVARIVRDSTAICLAA